MLSITNTKKRAAPGSKPTPRLLKKRKSGLIVQRSRRSLNSFPHEVLKQILCNIDSKVLFRLKYVCSKWNIIIKDLLEIQEVKVDYKRKSDALAIFEDFNSVSNYSEAFCSFTVYRSRYRLKNLINDNVISTLLRAKGEVDETKDGAFLSIMEEHAGDVSYLANPSDDRDFDDDAEYVREQAWKAVLAMTGLDYPMEQLRRHSLDDSIGMSLVKNYRSYYFGSHYFNSGTCMIILYPDRQTFSVLIHPETQIW